MPAPKRPYYFQSQFLVVRDFTEEQDYHREMLQLHNQLMHDWGVVGDGLKVTGSGVNLSIGAGSAIDSSGQLIMLEADTPIKIPSGQDVWITIAFQEVNSTDKDDKYPPPGGSDHVTRLVQSPLIEAPTTAPPTDGTVITLAKVTAAGTVDYSVRKLASSFMRVGRANDLSIGPGRQVGIGTADPRAPLHIKGDVALLNLEGDTHGFVQFFPKGFADGRKGWLGFGAAGDSNLRIENEADGGNVVLSSAKGYVGALCSAGDGQGIQFGNREIKFRGDKIQHFSIFANKVNKALTFAKSGSTHSMDTADANIMTLADSGNVGIGTTTPEGQLQIGDGWNRIGFGPTPDTPSNPTLYNVDYGTAYLGLNAVRTAQGWRRSPDGGNNNGGSIIYNRVQGDLCFVTLETNTKQEFFSDGDIKDRKRMVISATGNVSIANDLNVRGALSVGNGVNLNSKPLTLRADNNGPDINHGLAYFGGGATTMGDFAMDGPVLYGSHGGALGTYGAKKVALRWDDQGNVGIGTTTPLSALSISSVTTKANTAGQTIGELSFIGFSRPSASASILALSKDWDDTGHLIFKTSDGAGNGGAKERLRITSAGNVGIATAGNVVVWGSAATPGPVAKLHVVADAPSMDYPAGTGTQQLGHVARLQDGSGFLTLDLGGYEKFGFWLQSTDVNNLATNYPLLLNPNGGNVGIGNAQPRFKLSTRDSDTIGTGVLRLQNSYMGGNNDYSTSYGIELAGIDNGTNGHDLRIRGRTGPANDFSDLVIVKNDGRVGIGTMTPKALLDVGDMTTGVKSVLARMSEGNDDKEPGTCLAVTSYTTQGTGATSFAIEHYFYGNRNGYITFCRGGGSDNGFVKFGGTDLAELFESAEQIVPGDVVVFDEQDSLVKLCESEADSCVIGIVSGAPGAVLGKDDNNGSPIALCGRVPCNVDADIAPIQFGDLLTTSPTKGHAQKVLDHTKAAGAIIGKALGSLGKGKGQVTVLVALA